MATRRNFLVGLGNVVVGSAAVTTGSFSESASPSADMRVIADSRCPRPGLRLVPAREDEAYVLTDADGEVTEFVLDGTDSDAEGLSKAAESRFERLVKVTNGESAPAIEELYLDFEVSDEGLAPADPTPAEIEDALFIASQWGDIPGNGTTDYLTVVDQSGSTDGEIAGGEEVPFGIGVDLLPSSSIQELPDPAKFSVKLLVSALSEDYPGCGTPDGPPINGVEWKGGQIKSIHSPEDRDITVDLWYFDETSGGSNSGGGPPGEGNGNTTEPIQDFQVECSVDAETNSPLQSFVTGPASSSHVAVYIHEANASWHHPDFDPQAGETTGWTQNTQGVEWGSGSIGTAFDVDCQ